MSVPAQAARPEPVDPAEEIRRLLPDGDWTDGAGAWVQCHANGDGTYQVTGERLAGRLVAAILRALPASA